MLQVILEQKWLLAAYAIEYGGVQQLTAAQLYLAGKVVKIFGCVEAITKSISTEATSTSLIIPFIQAFPFNNREACLALLNRHYRNMETKLH